MKAFSFDQLAANMTAINELPANKIMSVLAAGEGFMDRFYLTGYEGLCLNMSHESLTEAVISSVVPMERELLVIGDGAACEIWRKVCHSLSIHVSVIDASVENILEAVETIMKVNTSISHIMTTTLCGSEMLTKIGDIAHKHRASMVVDNTDDELSLGDIESAGVDFAIASSSCGISTIVAKRSRLVMTEGNARSAEQDIYAIWQGTLQERKSTWMPMT